MILKKLAAARLEIQKRALKKSGLVKTNAGRNFKYFELADFLPAVNEIAARDNWCGVVSFFRDNAVLTLTDFEDGTECRISCPVEVGGNFGSVMQAWGAVQTYARRYLWMAALELVEDDQLDGTLDQQQQAPARQKTAASNAVKRAVSDNPAAVKRWGLEIETAETVDALMEVFRRFSMDMQISAGDFEELRAECTAKKQRLGEKK